MSTFFDELLESVQQMDDVVKGERASSREFHVDAIQVKEIREATGLTQVQFAQRIGIEVATLRNWEQGRREPTGPAKALLTAIKNDPKHVLQALGA
ncbi:MAG: helix-turn-helix domain-containing protein [Gammaproteobacteria bacterium]|nr:helix-turn-helix domain-containing protein [Gammaproteobacteria bacterium]